MINNELLKTLSSTIKGAKTVGLLQESQDYDSFKFHPLNRTVKRENVNNIKRSMEIKNLLIPILINEKGEIIDGQHRFTAWKELGLPIWFYIVEGYDIDEMQKTNLYKENWSWKDYLELYIKRGNQNYKQFDELLKKYTLNYSDLLKAIELLSYEQIGDFNSGDLQIENYIGLIEFLEELTLFDKYEYSRSTGFVKAFLKLYVKDFYDKDYMRLRIDTCDDKLKEGKRSTINEYALLLAEKIYSNKSRNIIVTYNEGYNDYFTVNINGQGKKKVGA